MGLGKIPGHPAEGREKSYADAYADADTIPGMAPSTEGEGGSPAKNYDFRQIYDLIMCA